MPRSTWQNPDQPCVGEFGGVAEPKGRPVPGAWAAADDWLTFCGLTVRTAYAAADANEREADVTFWESYATKTKTNNDLHVDIERDGGWTLSDREIASDKRDLEVDIGDGYPDPSPIGGGYREGL